MVWSYAHDMLRIKTQFFVLLLILLTACNRHSSKDQASQSLEAIESWLATTQMVVDAWNQGKVPTVYTQQTLEKAQQEIHRARQTLAKSPISTVSPFELSQVEQTVNQLSVLVRQDNHQAIAQPLQQLVAEQQRLSSFAKTIEVQP